VQQADCCDGCDRVPGERRGDLPGDVAVGAAARLPDRQQLQRRLADVGASQFGGDLVGGESEHAQIADLAVVGATATDRALEDRRVRRHSHDRVLGDQPLQFAGREQIAGEPVDPDGLAEA
jgi:hypothetical protein